MPLDIHKRTKLRLPSRLGAVRQPQICQNLLKNKLIDGLNLPHNFVFENCSLFRQTCFELSNVYFLSRINEHKGKCS